MTTSDTGSRVVGAMLKLKGEEYLKKLRTQDIALHSVSAQALNDMIISGEVEASPTIFRNHVLVAMQKQAPVAWVPMEVVPASGGSAGISAQAPHPHAAVLFFDFMLGDAQEIMLKRNFAPSSARVAASATDIPQFTLIDPKLVLDEGDKWTKLYEEIIVKQAPTR